MLEALQRAINASQEDDDDASPQQLLQQLQLDTPPPPLSALTLEQAVDAMIANGAFDDDYYGDDADGPYDPADPLSLAPSTDGALSVPQSRRIRYEFFDETPLPRTWRTPPRRIRRALDLSTVWITGAEGGLGARIAIHAAAAGARVLLTGVDAAALARTQRAALAAWKRARSYTREDAFLHGWRPAEVAYTFPMDVADTQYAEDAVKAAEEVLDQPVYAIIHCTDVPPLLSHGSGGPSPTGTFPERSVMDRAFFGAVALTRALLPGMELRGDGCIVAVVADGTHAPPDAAALAAATVGYFDALRAEEAVFGIAVTVAHFGAAAAAAQHGSPGRQTEEDVAALDVAARRIVRAIARRAPEVHASRPWQRRWRALLRAVAPERSLRADAAAAAAAAAAGGGGVGAAPGAGDAGGADGVGNAAGGSAVDGAVDSGGGAGG